MTNLVISMNQFEQAVQFIVNEGRLLERTLYAYEFEGGSEEDVIRELAVYQNADGGFGKGLEPDIRTEVSSAIATTVALQHLKTVGAGSNSPIVKDAIRYLIDTYNRAQRAGWDIVPPDVELAPRAPWWNYNAAHEGWGNPAIEIVGYFHKYADLVPVNILNELTQHAITYINEGSTRKDFHELFCCLRFAELVPESVLREVKPVIDEMVMNCVTTDPDGWNGYCLMPLQVAESPNSIYHEKLGDSVKLNLGHLLAKQQANGAWSPTWSWGQYEDVWAKAEQEWKGVLTLDALRRLKAYGIVTS